MKSPLSNIFKTSVSEILPGFTDWHCHLLPGVDDGPRTMEETREMLREYENAGVRTLWFTPHIMEDMPGDTKELSTAFESLRRSYSGLLMINLASENMLDFLFERRLEEKDFLPLPGRRLMVETSFYNPPEDFDGILRRIKSAGFFPVLAHPERYIYMDEARYRNLHESGVKFQLNIPSFTGFYGEEVKERAEMLADLGFCDYAGSDCHRPGELSRLKEEYLSRKYADALSGR